MFETEKNALMARIEAFCAQNGLPGNKLEWRNIPFSGEWGIAAPLFPLAAVDPKREEPVPAHAQILGDQLVGFLGQVEGFARIEAVKGYLNLFFDTHRYANAVI